MSDLWLLSLWNLRLNWAGKQGNRCQRELNTGSLKDLKIIEFQKKKGRQYFVVVELSVKDQRKTGKSRCNKCKTPSCFVESKCFHSYLPEDQVRLLPQTQRLRIPLVLGLMFSFLLYLIFLSFGMIQFVDVCVCGGCIVRKLWQDFEQLQSMIRWPLKRDTTCSGIFGKLLNVSALTSLTGP